MLGRKRIGQKSIGLIKDYLKPFVDADVINEEEFTLVLNKLTKKEENNVKPTTPQLISRKRCAEILDISTRQLDRYVEKGLLRRIKLSRKAVKFNLVEVYDFINSGEKYAKEKREKSRIKKANK